MSITQLLGVSHHYIWFLASVAVIIALLTLLKITSRKKQTVQYRYAKRRYLISRAEHECYDALITAVGKDFYIFAQVHLSALVDHEVKGQNWRGALSHIDRKSIDFILCDKSFLSPILVIELDDRTHLSEERQNRDSEVERILSEANIPLLRIENHGTFDPNTLALSVKQKLG